MAVTIRFNPTATAIQADGNNGDEIISTMRQYTGNPDWNNTIVEGMYYVAFMGKVNVLNEAEYNAAMGTV